MEKLQVPEGKFIIGLTGNIATGKSAIMKLARERGALTIDADKIVHEIYAEDEQVQTAVFEVFGTAVQNSGGGIDPSVAEILFEPFVTTRRGGREGVGLGLFLSERLVAAHGGRLTFESAPGGTTFTIRVPGSARDS